MKKFILSSAIAACLAIPAAMHAEETGDGKLVYTVTGTRTLYTNGVAETPTIESFKLTVDPYSEDMYDVYTIAGYDVPEDGGYPTTSLINAYGTWYVNADGGNVVDFDGDNQIVISGPGNSYNWQSLVSIVFPTSTAAGSMADFTIWKINEDEDEYTLLASWSNLKITTGDEPGDEEGKLVYTVTGTRTLYTDGVSGEPTNTSFDLTIAPYDETTYDVYTIAGYDVPEDGGYPTTSLINAYGTWYVNPDGGNVVDFDGDNQIVISGPGNSYNWQSLISIVFPTSTAAGSMADFTIWKINEDEDEYTLLASWSNLKITTGDEPGDEPGVEPEPEQGYFISGEFNGYNPAGAEEWQLEKYSVGDLFEYYTGTFTVGLGEFSFNIQANGYTLVPADSNGTVKFTKGEYSAEFVEVAGPSTECWVYPDWFGGTIDVTIQNGKITIVSHEVDTNCYLRGAFNDYTSTVDWKLIKDQDTPGLYYGFFDIEEGDFSFNIAFGSLAYLVPALPLGSGITAATESLEIEFNDDLYEGYVTEGTANVYWTYENWPGGSIVMTVDMKNNTIEIEADMDQQSSVSKLNDEDGRSDIYNLQGVKVNADRLSNGIYIINGKKVMIRK